MDISELIAMGEKVARENKRGYGVESYYTGEKYQNWLALAIRFVESNFPGDPDTVRFRRIAEEADGFGDERYHPLISILKAFQQNPPVPPKNDIMPIIAEICNNFNKFDVNIKRRHGNRSTITINDEYDVQDAMLAILKLFVDDIRPEDFVPSYAGSNSRVDFLLPQHGVVIETKMTNRGLSDKQIGEQLIIDVERYKQHPGCNHLVCFVYDKDSHITNPYGLIDDIEKLSDQKMRITVFISPQ
ncbi:PD-(D/E)XK nuclease domain-containing protein [Bacillus litorisediminis]|uniref:PD-(D/E)XK nuclease domain-containing protein n=1 Tax=Bacillus litorisediminis TaxID=2922713 RepID=UPI001FAE6C4E|nr:hypothetical protein [Bacillus litorisediminis]